MKISIDVTPEQHQQLTAVAALRGKTIQDHVLDCVLPDATSPETAVALRQLAAYLEPRIKATEAGQVVQKSVEQIVEETHQEMR